jgi:subtilisin family serine protease
MKKLPLLLVLVLFVSVNSCRKNETPPVDLLTKPDPAELDRFMQNQLETKGEFVWSWASEEMIWTALSNSDYVLSVGYQPLGTQNVLENIHKINTQDADWQKARRDVMQQILSSEQKINPAITEEKLLAFPENPLPYFMVYVKNPETITLLRNNPTVRYAEPVGYEPYMTKVAERSSSGCGSNNAQTNLVPNVDYINIAPACKQPWNHSFHSISGAWNNSTGSGATVCVIDSGCSDEQDNLGEAFNQGQSSGREIDKRITFPGASSPDDACGHGTSMLGACGAPRGTDGAAVGIAYNANLVSIRATEDVYINTSSEITGVSNAFYNAGADGDIRIISLSLGRLGSVSQITDAIVYAHNAGKLIFAAAGTSFSWTAWFTGVIYPASLSQCVAVTGIKDNLTQRCAACHSGSKVDFVLVMEKASNGRHVPTLANSGNVPSTVGGSSVSTASTAGIAALVWSKYPGWSRTQVMDRLKSSANYWPNRNSSFGWGRINAQTATQ